MDDKREIIMVQLGSRGGVTLDILTLYPHIQILFVLVSRRQTYCTGHSSGMGLSEFSARGGPCMERVGDGSVGAIDISRSRCPLS